MQCLTVPAREPSRVNARHARLSGWVRSLRAGWGGGIRTATARIPLEIRPAAAADIEAFAEDLKAAGLSVDDARRRLQGGEVPIISVSGGRLTHLNWLVFAGPVLLGGLGLTLHLRPGNVYNSYAVTLGTSIEQTAHRESQR